MVTVEQVKAELLAIQMEKAKAELMEKLAFQKELRRNFGIRINYAAEHKQLSPIALQRKERGEARNEIAEQNRKAQLALFTKRQEEMAMRILERMYARND